MAYDWKADSHGSWLYAHHMIRLRKGLRRFETLSEMYLVEVWGEIP